MLDGLGARRAVQAICAQELKRRVLSGKYKLPDSLTADSRDLIRQASGAHVVESHT